MGAFFTCLLFVVGGPSACEEGLPRHYLAVLEDPGGLQTPVVQAPFACDELVPSWNVDVAPGAGFLVELRVGFGQAPWSPWLACGGWELPPSELEALGRRFEEVDPSGRVDVDTFLAARPFDRAQLRFRSVPRVSGEDELVVTRAALCFTSTRARVPKRRERAAGRATGAGLVLDVPFRSQRWEQAELAPRACSPTSLAMVLAYRGCERSTASIAERVYDPVHELYGNWPSAIQAAYTLGYPGHVARFSDWADVAALLAAGTPLVASVRVGPGELGGAAFPSSEGHLIVLRGIAPDGSILVCDPAFEDEQRGRTRYAREDLERVWLSHRRGTAYVIEGARSPGSARPSAVPSGD